MAYSKPFLTYKQQIDRLKNEYKLNIQNDDFAIHALSTMSYYDLINGYKDTFMKNGKFIEGASIEYLYTFYLFDNTFQNILFKQSIFIENIFKTRLAYIIAKNLGEHEDEYLHKSKYLSYMKNDSKMTFHKIKENIVEVYTKHHHKYIHQPTRHYVEMHNHIPPWILFKNISFGNAINLYRLLKKTEKSEVTNAMVRDDSISYKDKVDFLTNSLNIIRDFRNQIAHNLKFITYETRNWVSPKTINRLAPDSLYTDSDIDKKIGSRDIYAQIISIIVLLDNPFLISEFLTEILNHISSHARMIPEREKGLQEGIYADYSAVTRLPINLADRINDYIHYIS